MELRKEEIRSSFEASSFDSTGIGTADFKKRYLTTGTAVDFESTASKPELSCTCMNFHEKY